MVFQICKWNKVHSVLDRKYDEAMKMNNPVGLAIANTLSGIISEIEKSGCVIKIQRKLSGEGAAIDSTDKE